MGNHGDTQVRAGFLLFSGGSRTYSFSPVSLSFLICERTMVRAPPGQHETYPRHLGADPNSKASAASREGLR